METSLARYQNSVSRRLTSFGVKAEEAKRLMKDKWKNRYTWMGAATLFVIC